jgi:hypothetical protein
MSNLINYVCEYISATILGFESGTYKMIFQNQKDKLSSLRDKYHTFITIFRDLHEIYYTKTFNSIIKRDDDYVTKIFDQFRSVTSHSYQCLLNILANLTVSIHFNVDRKKLDVTTYESYMTTLQNEINDTIDTLDLKQLFVDHQCSGPKDNELVEIPLGKKFIHIKLSTNVNGNEKIINSHADLEQIDNSNKKN